jgi:hypothetical protein
MKKHYLSKKLKDSLELFLLRLLNLFLKFSNILLLFLLEIRIT